MDRESWKLYERRKAELQEQALSPEEYERELAGIVGELEI